MSAEDNKALCRRFFQEFWIQKNLAVADELLAANFVDHTPGSPPGLPPGPEGHKQFAVLYFTAFPDIRATIEDMVAQGDKVVIRWRVQGTNTGSLFGMPATNKSATFTGITINRVTSDKIAEQWVNFDALGMMQHLGLLPAPGQGS
jgi:predicted ester cyclase